MAVEDPPASKRMTHNNLLIVWEPDFDPLSHSKADKGFLMKKAKPPPFLALVGRSLWKQV